MVEWVTDVPFSPLTGDWVVGADYPERAGLGGGASPAGMMETMAAFARPGFDPAAVHPDVRRFYEETARHRLAYRTRWHRPFRTGAGLASRVTSWLRQVNLPGPGDDAVHRVESRFVDIDPARDPRDDARLWIRTDAETGRAVFVAAYATHERRRRRYVNIAAPLPGCNLTAVLRVDHRRSGAGGGAPTRDEGRPPRDDASAPGGGTGVCLTTRGNGDEGLYLTRSGRGVETPLSQTFRVWPVGATTAPSVDVAMDGTTVKARHTMWLAGLRFLTVEYAIAPHSDFCSSFRDRPHESVRSNR